MNYKLILVMLAAFLSSLGSIFCMQQTTSFNNFNNNFRIFQNGKLVYEEKSERTMDPKLAELELKYFPIPINLPVPDLSQLQICARNVTVQNCNSNTTANISIDTVNVRGAQYSHYQGTIERNGKTETVNYYTDAHGKKFTPVEFNRIRTGKKPSIITLSNIKKDRNTLSTLTCNLNSLANED